MAGSLKKTTKVKINLLTDIYMLLMVKKGIRGGICHTIHQYTKADIKYMKDYDQNKESPYLKYCNVNNLHGWEICQKLPENGFKWVEDTSEFNEDLIKPYNYESDEGYFLEVVVQYFENLYYVHDGLTFLPEKIKTAKFEKL